MRISFLMISARVALVPMPEPLIWARSSSSSMSCPAFSMARIMEPDVYRLGGEVLLSRISKPLTVRRSPCLSVSASASSFLELFFFSLPASSSACSPVFVWEAGFSSSSASSSVLPMTSRNPSVLSTFAEANSDSFSMPTTSFNVWYSAGG